MTIFLLQYVQAKSVLFLNGRSDSQHKQLSKCSKNFCTVFADQKTIFSRIHFEKELFTINYLHWMS